jgi:hypothetical protein
MRLIASTVIEALVLTGFLGTTTRSMRPSRTWFEVGNATQGAMCYRSARVAGGKARAYRYQAAPNLSSLAARPPSD